MWSSEKKSIQESKRIVIQYQYTIDPENDIQIKDNFKSKGKGKKSLKEFLQSIRCKGFEYGTWHRVCLDQHCKQNAIICNKDGCDCRLGHKVCHTESAEYFVSKAIKKSNLKVKNQWLNSLKLEISKLSAEIKEIYTRLRMCFLDRSESNFVFCLQSGKTLKLESLTGQQMFTVNRELEMPISKEGLNEKVKRTWSNLPLQKIDDMISSSLSIVESLEDKRQWFEKNNLQQIRITKIKSKEARIEALMSSSKVLTTIEQCQMLFAMFPENKRPKWFKLLFRASDHDFDAVKTKKKWCGVANTILLVKTQYGKLIGGFTPLNWRIPDEQFGQQKQSIDMSGESFIFSISNNHKLILQSPTQHQAIYHWKNCGPQFNGGILIRDRSNVCKSSCLFDYQMYYVHPEYKAQDKESWIKFSGSSDGKFTICQWEVHQVVF